MEYERKSSIKNKSIKNKSSVRQSNFKPENNNKVPESEKEIKIEASEFTKEELEDPESIDNLNSIKVMEILVKRLDEKIKKIEGRPPAKLRQKFLQTKCRYNTLKEQIMENSLTIDGYVLLIKKQIDKDKKFILYFRQNDMKDKLAIVSERMNLEIQELNDAINHAKKNC